MSAAAAGDEVAATALHQQAIIAMKSGRFAEAKELIEQALRLRGNGLLLWLNLAACHRQMGDVDAALAAADHALRINPRSFRGLLLKAQLTEQAGARGQAMDLFRSAVALAPLAEQVDAPTLQALMQARDRLAAHSQALTEFLLDEVRDAALTRPGSPEALRVDEFVRLLGGGRRVYRQAPTDLHYPGLPDIEFYPREHFAWIGELEAATPSIRAELDVVLRRDQEDFVPYITYPDNVPLDQWATLNHSRRWSALHLLHYGEPVPAVAARFPRTMQLLSGMPQPRMKGRSPAAMVSALQAQTHIPPHTGVANTRLVVHLPLIVPENCGFRVGNSIRQWQTGQAWVFDDTIEHEAWNRSDQARFILIFDVWNPLLSETERALITRAVAAKDRFNGISASGDL